MAAQRVGVKMKAWARKSGIKHGGAHQPAPEQRAPIIRLRREGLIIEQAVVTCDQCIVGDDANILFREAAKLIEIANVSINVAAHGLPPHAASAVSVSQNGLPGSNSSRS